MCIRDSPSPLSRIKLNPGTEVVIKKVKEDELVSKVYVYGQVWRPGVYKITEKTTLYDVLKAAGGFKPTAYPKGLVLLRNSIAQMQRERLQRALTILKAQLLKEEAGYMQAQMEKSQKEAYKAAFEAKHKLLREMEKTQVTGRLVGLNIPPNLEALKNSPSNVILEDGDQIYVPKIPSAVLVFGEVQNPSAILYKPNLTVKDYISLAGSFTKDADVENIFIIKANGVAISKDTDRSLIEWNSEQKRFIWGYAYNDLLNYKLEPGDAVIVPTKIHVPTMWRPLIKDVVQIIYQSALTVYTISNL
jgi:polysaccharide export outer membrane protein